MSRRPRKLRQKQLNIKYRWKGMSKTNYRKHNRRRRFQHV